RRLALRWWRCLRCWRMTHGGASSNSRPSGAEIRWTMRSRGGRREQAHWLKLRRLPDRRGDQGRRRKTRRKRRSRNPAQVEHGRRPRCPELLLGVVALTPLRLLLHPLAIFERLDFLALV